MTRIWISRIGRLAVLAGCVCVLDGCTAIKESRATSRLNADLDRTLDIADGYALSGDTERARVLYQEVLTEKSDSKRAKAGLAGLEKVQAKNPETATSIAKSGESEKSIAQSEASETRAAKPKVRPTRKKTFSENASDIVFFEQGDSGEISAEDLEFFTDDAIFFEGSESSLEVAVAPPGTEETASNGPVEVASYTPAPNPFEEFVEERTDRNSDCSVEFSGNPWADSSLEARDPLANVFEDEALVDERQEFEAILREAELAAGEQHPLDSSLVEADALLQEFLDYMSNTEAEHAPVMGTLISQARLAEQRPDISLPVELADDPALVARNEASHPQEIEFFLPAASTAAIADQPAESAEASQWTPRSKDHAVTPVMQTVAVSAATMKLPETKTVSAWRTYKRPMPETRMEYLQMLLDAKERLIVNADDVEAWRTIDDLLTIDDSAKKSLTILTLGELPQSCHAGTVQRLRTLLVTESHDETKAAAVLALGGMGDDAKVAVPILQEIVLTGGLQSREAAIVTLACLGYEHQ